jgi:hypothetical protein
MLPLAHLPAYLTALFANLLDSGNLIIEQTVNWIITQYQPSKMASGRLLNNKLLNNINKIIWIWKYDSTASAGSLKGRYRVIESERSLRNRSLYHELPLDQSPFEF